MSEQRIDHAADSAVEQHPDQGEGQGIQRAGAHGDMLTSDAGPAGSGPDASPQADADTEGERFVRETAHIAEEQQGAT